MKHLSTPCNISLQEWKHLKGEESLHIVGPQ